jgi:ribosomal protein L37AE/L43A
MSFLEVILQKNDGESSPSFKRGMKPSEGGVYFAKVNADGTSQTCPKCNHHTGKKDLSQRIHRCSECGYTTDRDVAAAQVVVQRGLAAVGHTVKLLGEGLGFPPGSGKTLAPH